MAMLGTAVAGLDHLDTLVPAVSALGRRHAGYGLKAQHYVQVGSALLWALEKALARRIHVRGQGCLGERLHSSLDDDDRRGQRKAYGGMTALCMPNTQSIGRWTRAGSSSKQPTHLRRRALGKSESERSCVPRVSPKRHRLRLLAIKC